VIERRRGGDLGGDGTVAGTGQQAAVRRARRLGGALLVGAVRVNRRAVLRPGIVPLPHPLRRVVVLPEHAQELVVADALRIEHHLHHFGVAGETRADLAVGRVRRGPARVADGGAEDALLFPELALGAPEAAHCERGQLEPRRKRRFERRAVDEVARRDRHPLGAAGERLPRCRQLVLGGAPHADILARACPRRQRRARARMSVSAWQPPCRVYARISTSCRRRSPSSRASSSAIRFATRRSRWSCRRCWRGASAASTAGTTKGTCAPRWPGWPVSWPSATPPRTWCRRSAKRGSSTTSALPRCARRGWPRSPPRPSGRRRTTGTPIRPSRS